MSRSLERAARALTALTLLLLAGCGGKGAAPAAYVDHEPLPPDTFTVSMHEPGTYGGRFRVGATASPKTFNGPMANEQSSNDVCNLLYSALTDINYETGDDIPLVAKSWEYSDGDRTVTFHLRRGLRFSDGHPLTSDDVKFSFDVAMDDSLHVVAQEGLTYLDPVTKRRTKFTYSAPDSYTFVVHAPMPYALMLAATGSVRIVPKHVLGQAFERGTYASAYGIDTPPAQIVTSGAWRVKAFEPNQSVLLERNPYWFGVDAKGRRLPYLDNVLFIVAKDQNTIALKFQAGELDGYDNVKPEDFREYEKNQAKGGYTLYDVGPSYNTNFMWFNLNPAPSDGNGVKAGEPAVGPVKYAWFNDRRFRQAVSKAIDREALIKGPFHGYGMKTWSTMTPGNKKWFDPTLVGADYDPGGARALLASLGWKDSNGDGYLEDGRGNTISFTAMTNADNLMRQDMLNLIKDDLAKVGVKLVPNPVDFNTMITHMRNDYQYEAALLGLGSAVPSDPGMGQNVWRSSGLTHYWRAKSKKPGSPEEARIDQLMQQNVYTLDPGVRRGTWREIMDIVNTECWIVWLPVQRMMIPVSSKFGNVSPSPMPHRILWNIDRVFVKPGGGAR